jgi:hypothetical protein
MIIAYPIALPIAEPIASAIATGIGGSPNTSGNTIPAGFELLYDDGLTELLVDDDRVYLMETA